MAINLNCNLNGGDTVTPNNELFYRIYGNVDNYASPIHTTGTALADSNVTVNGDVVDISNVDVTTNTSFKIAAVDGAGNEGILSDAVSSSIALPFDELFTGTTLNPAPVKWTITNPAPGVVFSQDDELLSNLDASGGNTGYIQDYLRGVSGYDVSEYGLLAFAFDLQASDNSTTVNWYAGMSTTSPPADSDNYSFFTCAVPTSYIRVTCATKIGGVAQDTITEDSSDFVASYTSFKILITTESIAYKYWNGSSWVTLGQTVMPIGGVWYPFLCARAIASTGLVKYDNIHIRDTDWTGRYPV